MDDQSLLNGIVIDSLVLVHSHGIKECGIVVEIDELDSSSCRGNVRVQYILSERWDWYHPIDVRLLTPEVCQQYRAQLQGALQRLDKAQAWIESPTTEHKP